MGFINSLKKKTIALAILSALCAGTVSAADFDWYNGRWAQESSDLLPDPNVVFGYLDNGIRWAYIPNANPKGRLTIRLNVQVGSIMEEPHEFGLSHYLEHMAFNGSKNYPAGSLIPFFQKHGMSFGGDTNAHTSFAETVYKLNLTKTDSQSIAEGLSVLRDIADGLTLTQKEIDEERGVIFSEKRAGEEESYFALLDWEKKVYAGTRFLNYPIGTTEALNGINEQIMRHYYDKWYVPGRMTVVAVGDIDPKLLEKQMQKAFGSMEAKPLPKIQEIGEPDLNGTVAVVQNRPIQGTNVGIYMLWPQNELVDNEARQRENFIYTLIGRVLDMRLMERKEALPDILTIATFNNASNDWYCPDVHFKALTTKDHWKDALKVLQEELVRARDFGMTKSEFEMVKRQHEDFLKTKIAQRSSWTNDDYAALFIATMNSGQVFTSEAQDLERYRKNLETLTLDEVNEAMTRVLSQSNRRLKVSGDAETTETEVLDYWKKIENLKVEAPTETTTEVFPYLDLPRSDEAPVFTKVKLPVEGYDLTVEKATLSNGTEVILQPLPFEKGTVVISYLFGDGLQGIEDKTVPTAQMADRLLSRAGVGKYNEVQTARLFSGTGLGVSENVGDYYNEIMGNGVSTDVKRVLEAVWTQYRDPKLYESYRQTYLKVLKRIEYDRNHEIQGTLRYNQTAHFTGERKAAYRLSYSDASKISLEAAQQYLEDARQRGKRVLVIGGDFDRDVAIRVATDLFGTLPAATQKARRLGIAPVFPTDEERVITVDSVSKDKTNLLMGWEYDLKDINDRRTMAARLLASEVINDRLRVVIREKLGAAYSPYCYYSMDPEQDGFGRFMMKIQTKPELLKIVRQSVDEIIKDISLKGFSEEEINRQRKTLKTSWERQQKRNFYWQVLMIDEAMLGTPQVKWFEALGHDYDRVTREEVNHEAKGFFNGRHSALIVQSK